jgi:hypothetical protein
VLGGASRSKSRKYGQDIEETKLIIMISRVLETRIDKGNRTNAVVITMNIAATMRRKAEIGVMMRTRG